MSLHCYEDNSTHSDYYLIWDESDGEWYKDEALFCISQFKLGKTYKYFAKDNNVETEDETLETYTDQFGQVTTASNAPDCFWICENDTDGVNFNSFVENQFDADTLAQISEDPEYITTKANKKYGNVMSCVGEASDISDYYWEYWTYNPKLTEKEVMNTIAEFAK